MTGIVKILSLLPILYAEYEEVKLITQLNNYFNFDYNIYLLPASVDKHRVISGDNTPKSVYVLDVDTFPGWNETNKINSKNMFVIVVIDSTKFDYNLKLLLYQFHVRRFNLKIGMFFMHSASMKNLKDIFEECKARAIVNIFAAINVEGPHDERSLNVFTFNHFGLFDVINVTGGSETYERFFPSLKSNFQRHELGILIETARTRPSDILVWNEVIRLMNATDRIWKINNSSIEEVIKQNRIDVVPTPSKLSNEAYVYMYPISIERDVIIVPEALPYPEFAAYLQTLTSDKFLGYSLFTLVAIILLLIVIRYVEQKNILFFQSVCDVLNLLANDNGYIRYQRLCRAEVFLIVPFTFIGFVFVNGILSNLQSYLTRPVLQPQINTAEDLFRSPIKIVAFDMESKSRLVTLLTHVMPDQFWDDKILIEDIDELEVQLKMFNRSIAVQLPLSYAMILLELQKRLNIKGYHISEMRIASEVSIHPSAGLYAQWRRRDQTTYANILLQKHIEHLKNKGGSDTESDGLPLPTFIIYGWLAGVIIFIIEIIWKNLNFTLIKKFTTKCTQRFGH